VYSKSKNRLIRPEYFEVETCCNNIPAPKIKTQITPTGGQPIACNFSNETMIAANANITSNNPYDTTGESV
jgi:hypothetical protein